MIRVSANDDEVSQTSNVNASVSVSENASDDHGEDR